MSCFNGELGDKVGGIIGLHDVQNIGGSACFQLGEDRHAVIVAEFLKDVGQTRVGEFGGDCKLAIGGKIMDEVRKVRGLHVFGLLNKRCCGLV